MSNSNSQASEEAEEIFDDSEAIYGFNIPKGSEFSRKIIDSYTDWVKRPQIGALGLIWVKHNEDGTVKSSIDKFFSEEELKKLTESNPGDLSFIISGKKNKALNQLGSLRVEVGNRLGLRKNNEFEALWVTDFPLFEWDDETEIRK